MLSGVGERVGDLLYVEAACNLMLNLIFSGFHRGVLWREGSFQLRQAMSC